MTQFDEWAGETSTSYDPNEFYVAAQDKRGHGSSIKINLPSGVPGQIASLVSAVPQYRNAQDFYRDAIVHRLMSLQEKIPELQRQSSAFVEDLIIENVLARLDTEISILNKYEKATQAAEGPVWRAEVTMRARMAAETIANPRIAQRLRELG